MWRRLRGEMPPWGDASVVEMFWWPFPLFLVSVCFGDNIFHCTVVEAFICSFTLFGGFSGEKEVDTVRISRKLYFPADEVSRKRNFPTIPQTSTLLFRRSAFYSCLQYITAPLSVHISRSFRINSAFSVIYTRLSVPSYCTFSCDSN